MSTKLLLRSIFWLLITCSTFLNGIILEIENLDKFEEVVQKLGCKSLVLFDVDYTLLTPKDASLKPCGKDLRRKYLHGLDPKQREYLQSILALESEEELIDSSLPLLIKRLQKNKIHLIGLTALETGEYGKIKQLEDWRINQLKKFKIDFSSEFQGYNPIHLTECTSYNNHYPLFKNGVIFSNRQSKGEVLAIFLQKIGWMPNKIVFIDDSINQIKSVELAAEKLDIAFIGFHYTAAEKNSCGFEPLLGEFQFKNLVDNEIWINESKAIELLYNIKSKNL